MRSILLFLHTIRFLRWQQLFFRVLARVKRINVSPQNAPVTASWKQSWREPSVKSQSLFSDDHCEFLGESHVIRGAEDWNSSRISKLWLYNLHYFDDLGAVGWEGRVDLQRYWIARWLKENPAPYGNGWEPYPLSLRIVNWVKWLSNGRNVPTGWLDSLALQADILSKRLEYHLMGNHLFANGKALIFVGAYFSGSQAEKWIEKGLSILDHEINEQFLPDGAHFELSPMYHATLLWDLLDLINLVLRSGNTELTAREAVWREYAERGLNWLVGLCHEDGEIAFFNDAAFGIAPPLAKVVEYAKQLGITPHPVVSVPKGQVSATHFPSSGYVRIGWESAVALIDVAKIGPDYLPGHAHADTLSFEWSLQNQRVLVNSGTSQYGLGDERQRQRGTSAHNTVMINGADSSEVWAGFRVARRAYPENLVLEKTLASARLACSHTGYRRLRGRPVHRREWVASDRALTITDTIVGKFERAEAYFHLHPSVQVSVNGSEAELLLVTGRIVHFSVDGGEFQLQPSNWHPRFGVSQDNQRLAIRFLKSTIRSTLTW